MCATNLGKSLFGHNCDLGTHFYKRKSVKFLKLMSIAKQNNNQLFDIKLAVGVAFYIISFLKDKAKNKNNLGALTNAIKLRVI